MAFRPQTPRLIRELKRKLLGSSDDQLPAKKLRNFDDTNRWDRIVNVEGQKFHVLAGHLANHSAFFNGLFFGEYVEMNQVEVGLLDPTVKAADFQVFLEVTHGELSIRDSNIINLMHLADMWCADTVMKQCEKFLKTESKKPALQKFEIAKLYRCEELMKHIVNSLTTMDELMTLLPADLESLEKPILSLIFKRSLVLPSLVLFQPTAQNMMPYLRPMWNGTFFPGVQL